MKREPSQVDFGFMRWGGRRRGAGRKRSSERARVAHLARPVLKARFPVLVTMRLRKGLRSLRRAAEHRLVEAALVAASDERFRVVEYSVLSNHLHLIVEARDERALTRGMIGLSVRVARGLNRLWRRFGSVLDDRFHARILTTPRAVRTALVYVLANARKHGCRMASLLDAYSSAPTFDGWKPSRRKGAESSSCNTPRRLARACTWLLAHGWRRLGLLHPTETPRPGAARLT